MSSTESHYFEYGESELEYLISKDKKLADVISKVGKIERTVRPDLFTALMRTIVGQQISVKAQVTIWQRIGDALGIINPENIVSYSSDSLQKLGLSYRKVSYMQDIAQKVFDKELDLHALYDMTDDEVKKELCKLRGIGEWSAEMLMLFSMQRPNILSFGDLAIIRGLRMLHHHREITPTLFKKYQNRYTPYASVASLYLWAIAGGAVADMKDYQIKPNTKTTSKKQPKKSRLNVKKNTTEKNITEISAFYTTTLGVLEIRSFHEFISYVQFVAADTDLTQSQPNSVTDNAISQIHEYLEGSRTHFDIPIQQQGTDFQQGVWQQLCTIPYGSTQSYKDVATQVGNANASRAVGMANNKNKIAIIVPCHRVVGSNGKLVGYAAGLDIKQQLLDIETT